MFSKEWMIPDMYWPEKEHGEYKSHEAVCVLNTSKEDAKISLKLYFEDRPPLKGIEFECKAERTVHFRMDKALVDGTSVPRGVPYAALVSSTVPVAVQYSRLDSTQSENAMITTIACPI